MGILHIPDVPGDVHETLPARAAAAGMSLRQYVVKVLAEHAEWPTLDEWLDEVRRLPPAPGPTSGSAAVRAARDEDAER